MGAIFWLVPDGTNPLYLNISTGDSDTAIADYSSGSLASNSTTDIPVVVKSYSFNIANIGGNGNSNFCTINAQLQVTK